MPIDDYATINSTAGGTLVFEQARLTPADIDVALLDDASTGPIPMALEGYGLCGRDEGGPFIAEGNLACPNGALPANNCATILGR